MDISLLGFSAVGQMFNVHPFFVHFPIALLPASLLLYFLGFPKKYRSLLVAGRACLYLAFAGAVAAVVTGLIAEDSIPHNETIHRLMETHQMVALLFLGLTGLSTAWSFFHEDQAPKRKWSFLAVMAVAMVAVLQTADLGGRMVFIEGAAVRPAVSTILAAPATPEAPRVPSPKPADEGHEHKHDHGNSH